MATVRTVINMALRRIGRLGSGESATNQEYVDCGNYLRGIYNQTISSGAIGRLQTIVLDSAVDVHQAQPNTHIIRSSEEVDDISFPVPESDGVEGCDYGDNRYPTSTALVNGSVIAITDGETNHTEYYIFDTTTMNWYTIRDLGLSDDFDQTDVDTLLALDLPLSEQDPTGLACRLAVIIAEDFGSEVGTGTQQMASIYQMNQSLGYGRAGVRDLQSRYDLD